MDTSNLRSSSTTAASDVTFNSINTDLTSTNVQDAVVELRHKFPSDGAKNQVLTKASSAELDHTWRTQTAENVGFEWSSAVDASNVQAAIDYLASTKASSLKYADSLASAMDLGRYRSGSTLQGSFKIEMPSASFYANIRITIKGFNRVNNNMSWTADIGGYYSGSKWTMGDAVLSPNCPFTVVRFGSDGTLPCIFLGEISTAWTQPMIWIENAIVGGSTAWEFPNNLPLTLITSDSGNTIHLTITPKVLKY